MQSHNRGLAARSTARSTQLIYTLHRQTPRLPGLSASHGPTRLRKLFFKLPGKFEIPTPLGTYNPDWAVVFEGDARVYFVAETKSSTVKEERRPSENLKIACGRKHFALSEDVVFKDVTRLAALLV